MKIQFRCFLLSTEANSLSTNNVTILSTATNLLLIKHLVILPESFILSAAAKPLLRLLLSYSPFVFPLVSYAVSLFSFSVSLLALLSCNFSLCVSQSFSQAHSLFYSLCCCSAESPGPFELLRELWKRCLCVFESASCRDCLCVCVCSHAGTGR